MVDGSMLGLCPEDSATRIVARFLHSVTIAAAFAEMSSYIEYTQSVMG